MGREGPLILGMMESKTHKDKQTNKQNGKTCQHSEMLSNWSLSNNKIAGTSLLLTNFLLLSGELCRIPAMCLQIKKNNNNNNKRKEKGQKKKKKRFAKRRIVKIQRTKRGGSGRGI